MRRALPILLTLSLVGAKPSVEAFSWCDSSLPTTLNPLFARSPQDVRAIDLVFDRLFDVPSQGGEPTSAIVASWEAVGADTIAVTPRGDVNWHDGEPLRAEDVCFTVRVMLDPGTPSAIAEPYRRHLLSCTVENGAAVVRLARPGGDPLERLGFHVLPAHASEGTAIAADHAFGRRPVGTGPYAAKLEDHAVSFTSAGAPHRAARYAAAEQRECGEKSTIDLLKGNLDAMVGLEPTPYLTDGFGTLPVGEPGFVFVAVNQGHAPLDRPEVRQALDLAIDRDQLWGQMLARDGNPPRLAGPHLDGHPCRASTPAPADLTQARSVLASAGVTKVRIGISEQTHQRERDVLNFVALQLQYAGLETERFVIRADDWNRKAVTGQLTEFDLLIGSWAWWAGSEIEDLFHTRTAGRGALNVFGWSDPTTDHLLEAIASADVAEDRLRACRAVDAHLAEQRPYLFLWTLPPLAAAFRPGVLDGGERRFADVLVSSGIR